MTSISLDLSKTPELELVGQVAGDISTAAHALGIPFFMAGAMARDLILTYGYAIDAGRKTEDIDWAMMVGTWEEFEALKARLIATGRFSAQPQAHRLLYKESWPIDLIPFGGIADGNGMISCPPDYQTVMSVLGFDEAYRSSLVVRLPGNIEIRVASLPGLALLKLFAWHERHITAPTKDALDFTLIARHYIDAGNQDRLYAQFSHLLAETDFDYALTGARMLGHDIALAFSDVMRQVAIDILTKETDIQGRLALVTAMHRDAEKALRTLEHVLKGLVEQPTPNPPR